MRWVKRRPKKSYFQNIQTGLHFSSTAQSEFLIFDFGGFQRGDRSVLKSQGGLQQPWVILIPCNVFFKGQGIQILSLPGFLSPSPCFGPKVWLHDELPHEVIKMCQLSKGCCKNITLFCSLIQLQNVTIWVDNWKSMVFEHHKMSCS